MATDAGVPLVVGHETSATYQFFVTSREW